MREKSQSTEQAVSWDGACEPRVTHTTATLRWAVTRCHGCQARLHQPCSSQSQSSPWGKQPKEVWRAGTAVAAWPTAPWQSNPWDSKTHISPSSKNAIGKCHFLLPDMFTAGMALEDLRSAAVIAVRGRKAQLCSHHCDLCLGSRFHPTTPTEEGSCTHQ